MIKRCSADTRYKGLRGVASTARVIRIIHLAWRDVHVYECTFYRRDFDKEDAGLTSVCTIRAARSYPEIDI